MKDNDMVLLHKRSTLAFYNISTAERRKFRRVRTILMATKNKSKPKFA